MTRADYYMEEMIEKIQRCGYKDINPRPKYADGTPAHTISVNSPLSLMKKKPMKTTENIPTARLVMTDAAEPKNEENADTLNSF